MIDEHSTTPGNGVKKLIFTLLHGTFARGSAWAVDDAHPERFRSRIRSEFGDKYEIEFEVVEWGNSGIRRIWDNTNHQRHYGAQKLSKHLDECEELADSTRRYVVAHSHAGNIAMYSLRDPVVRGKVSGLITLATPFLFSGPEPFRRDLLVFSAVVIAAVVLDTDSYLAWAYGILYVSIVLTLMLSGNLGKDTKSADKITAHFEKLEFAKKEDFENPSGRSSFLAIRSRNDEVRNLFGISGAVGRSFRIIWEKVNRFGNWAMGAYFLLLVPGMVLENIPVEIDISWLESLRGELDKQVLTPMLVGLTGVLAIMAIMRMTFAFDGVRWIASLRTWSKILPWEGAKKKVLPIYGFGRHTRVQDQSPPEIAKWVGELLEYEARSDT